MATAVFVINLGHGVLPETPVAHVAELVALLRHPLETS
jgi:uroporphyrinogen-III decarboxylase